MVQPIGEGEVLFTGPLPGAEEIAEDDLTRIFGLPVEMRAPTTVAAKDLGARHQQGHLQWNAIEINDALHERLPANAHCCCIAGQLAFFPA